ncbi:Mn(2+) transporter ATX2 [Lachancea thermotolerans CBS 6340]|uniref:KLTH0F18128p n=1 Tax=Lachancea thermotolerans (strain ATCC 56472 / CBS 6340 / NRRL Y-8284) TaxID=559295 RepID=C5DJP7_LACTC|nr:KLTH0F18128p [Lachancea thermotolerans CBS 6340]CAR24536.1 KLTH0F18128p [Lachancea thermotolerans CBS 6340]
MSVTLSEVLVTAFLFLTVVFAIGLVPIYLVGRRDAGESKYLAMFSLFGVGMLLGTSFMLVIPEGVEACLEHNGNVGLNLLIGFMVVFFLDNVASAVAKGAKTSRLSSFLQDAPEMNSWKDVLKPKKALTLVVRNQVVFALVVHGCSDGLAMGAATSNDSVKFATLIAIIIHKIPAVLSLSSVMVTKQHLPALEAVSNLLAFSMSTPGAYIVISALNLKKWEALEWVSGNILLMSGGSLLYAAVSALLGGHDRTPETHEVRGAEPLMSSSLDQEFTSKDMTPFEIVSSPVKEEVPHGETLYVVAGVIIPVIVSYLISEKS